MTTWTIIATIAAVAAAAAGIAAAIFAALSWKTAQRAADDQSKAFRREAAHDANEVIQEAKDRISQQK